LDLLNPEYSTGSRDDRTPPVGRVLTLVEQTRRAGQPVELTEEGTPPDSTGSADLVAYRVVQEALTNALKYDHGGRTSVLVRHGGREITVEVGTDGTGSRAASPGGSGRGLAGLRERVGVLGGDFEAGRRDDGGFRVRARIPAGTPAGPRRSGSWSATTRPSSAPACRPSSTPSPTWPWPGSAVTGAPPSNWPGGSARTSSSWTCACRSWTASRPPGCWPAPGSNTP